MRMYSVNVSFSFKLAIEIQIVCESNDYFLRFKQMHVDSNSSWYCRNLRYDFPIEFLTETIKNTVQADSGYSVCQFHPMSSVTWTTNSIFSPLK